MQGWVDLSWDATSSVVHNSTNKLTDTRSYWWGKHHVDFRSGSAGTCIRLHIVWYKHALSAHMELGHWVSGSSFTSGSSFWPGVRPEFFWFSKKCPKCKTYIWNAEMTKVVVRCLLLDWSHWMSVHAMNFCFYLWLLKFFWPENTSSHISRHLEFIIEQGQRVNWVSGSLDSRVTGSLGHNMWPSSTSGCQCRVLTRPRVAYLLPLAYNAQQTRCHVPARTTRIYLAITVSHSCQQNWLHCHQNDFGRLDLKRLIGITTTTKRLNWLLNWTSWRNNLLSM